MKKQLVFYFYIYQQNYSLYNDFINTFNTHLKCLQNYIDVFDSYKFILSFDNLNDTEYINKYKHYIVDYLKLNNKNVEFVIVQNNIDFREGIYFYKEIICKLEEYDGLVCFGHGKYDLLYNRDIIYKWLCMLHFQLFNDIDNIINRFNNDNISFFGSVPIMITLQGGKTLEIFSHYAGSFYWLYPKRILEKYNQFILYIKCVIDRIIENKIQNSYKLIYELAERFINIVSNVYNEGFQGNIIWQTYFKEYEDLPYYYDIFGHSVLGPNDVYKNKLVYEYLNIFDDNTFKKFYNFYNKIISYNYKLIPKLNNKCIIVIPLYKYKLSYYELQSITKVTESFANKYDIIYLIDNDFDIEKFNNDNNLNITNILKLKTYKLNSINSYNRLCLEKTFYEMFDNYTYTLIYQLDAYILNEKLLDVFIEKNYDYIGAPIDISDRNDDELKYFPKKIYYNGGLSLRKNSFFINILTNFKEVSFFLINVNNDEDLLFSSYVQLNGICANYEDALLFCVDNQLDTILDKISKKPFAVHHFGVEDDNGHNKIELMKELGWI